MYLKRKKMSLRQRGPWAKNFKLRSVGSGNCYEQSDISEMEL